MLSTFPRSVTFSTFFVSELNSAPGSSKSKQDCSDKVPAKAANATKNLYFFIFLFCYVLEVKFQRQTK